MKQFIIYSDLHLGALHEIQEKLEFNENTIFLGDNFDLKNISHENLEKFYKLREEIMEKASKSKGHFIDGNHELFELEEDNFYIIRNGIIFLHGDFIHRGFKKAKKWREKRSRGKTKNFIIAYKSFRKIFGSSTSKFIFSSFGKKFVRRAVRLAKEKECHTIVFGHFHLKKLFDKTQDGVRVICVPRGKTEISL